jgi:hypothetical protein
MLTRSRNRENKDKLGCFYWEVKRGRTKSVEIIAKDFLELHEHISQW